MHIPLGSIVRDKVTGIVGVAENRATYLFGCDRYCVQPQIKEDGPKVESFMVDEPQLEILHDQKPVMTALSPPAQEVALGSLVFDPIRNMSGTATGRAVYLNGCARVLVEPRRGLFVRPTENWWVDEPQLVLKKKSTFTRAQSFRNTGGPARSCSKY